MIESYRLSHYKLVNYEANIKLNQYDYTNYVLYIYGAKKLNDLNLKEFTAF